MTDKAAFDATRARVNQDPVALATLSMLFLDGYNAGKLPWTKPTGQNVPNQQAIAQPPSLSGDTLVYWRQHETRRPRALHADAVDRASRVSARR